MIAAARDCLGTPFHHQGRAAHMGLDCIGLIVHAARAAGLDVQDTTDYGRTPDSARLVKALAQHGFREAGKIMPGDVLVFRFNREPQHAALAVSSDAMIHAYAPMGRVVEAGLGESWRRRLTGIYRLVE